MKESLNPPEEYERKPNSVKLIEIEKAIDAEISKIDQSGSEFLAKNEILEQLREKYGWYEEWASLSPEDINEWAKLYQKHQKLKEDLFFYSKLARKNQQIAIEKLRPKVIKTTNRIENEVFESFAEKFKELKNLIEVASIKAVAKEFLEYLSELKKDLIFKDFIYNERSDVKYYQEEIESNIDRESDLHKILPLYIDALVKIIEGKKKSP